jgi:hypothetical protein
VPEITVNEGQPIVLHVWLNMDNTPLGRVLNSVSVSVDSSLPGVVQAAGFEVFDAHDDNAFTTRWAHNAAASNPEAAVCQVDPLLDPHTCIYGPSTGTAVVGLNTTPTRLVESASGAGATSARVGNNPNTFDFENGHDDPTSGFYFGELRLNAAHAGDTRLYFRVGEEKIIVSGQTAHPVQFGNAADTYQGNVVDAGAALGDATRPDAIIHVMGVIPTRDILSRFNDPATQPDRVVPGPTGGTPIDIPFNSPDGTLVAQDWRPSFFDVFINLESGDPTIAAALLQAQANNGMEADGYEVFLTPAPDDLGIGVDYELRVRFPSTPGTDQTFDFSFDPASGIVVGSLGIPEPSSVALSAMALVGLAFYGWRRRRG